MARRTGDASPPPTTDAARRRSRRPEVLLCGSAERRGLSTLEDLLTLVVIRFFLISRCTHCAYAAFQLFEKLELSFQSIMGKFELGPANGI